MQLAPGAGERFLAGVFRVSAIAQHRQREPQPRLDQGSEEGVERRLVAGDRAQPKRLVSRRRIDSRFRCRDNGAAPC